MKLQFIWNRMLDTITTESRDDDFRGVSITLWWPMFGFWRHPKTSPYLWALCLGYLEIRRWR